jgi:sporulation protein YlmC with PRC-barrel domain
MSKSGKTYATWVISAAVAAGLALGGTLAVAADKSRASNADKPTDSRVTEQGARTSNERQARMQPHPGGLIEAGWLIGTNVHDANGKAIGEIKHLWLDPKDGRVKDVIVSVGEKLGVGGRDKVVAWSDVKIAWKDQKIFASVDPTALRDAQQAQTDREDRGPAASPRTAPSR